MKTDIILFFCLIIFGCSDPAKNNLMSEAETKENYSNNNAFSSKRIYPDQLKQDLINRLSSIKIEEKRIDGRVVVRETGLRIYKDGTYKYFQLDKPKDGIGGVMYTMEGTFNLIGGTYKNKVEAYEDRYGDTGDTHYEYHCYIMLNNTLTYQGAPQKVAVSVSWYKINDDDPLITNETKICISGLNATANLDLGADYQDKIAPILGCYD